MSEETKKLTAKDFVIVLKETKERLGLETFQIPVDAVIGILERLEDNTEFMVDMDTQKLIDETVRLTLRYINGMNEDVFDDCVNIDSIEISLYDKTIEIDSVPVNTTAIADEIEGERDAICVYVKNNISKNKKDA